MARSLHWLAALAAPLLFTGAALAQRTRLETAKWAKAIKDARIEAQ